MREYNKPVIEDEKLELEDIIAASGTGELSSIWKDGDDDFLPGV